ncbi:excinuclease ATPase subunit [Marinobacterium arenosum]|uniref:excinuclease ATPase subunit n=1 Tax=Marinobacterium arenosum TaxID=2862496 RepID=UPI0028F45A92|nr:excinuclease ATPase subunit [Marinobacterium arenosum]
MKLLSAFLATALLLAAPEAYSRDTKHLMSIQEALASADFKERLDPSIRLYFGNQKHPRVAKALGTFSSNKKTNAFAKSDEEACRWVMLSALLALQERAKKEGGNAVIDIASYYKKNTYSSRTEFECHAGAIMAGVALTGKVVKLAN